jgi:hypothetical protein
MNLEKASREKLAQGPLNKLKRQLTNTAPVLRFSDFQFRLHAGRPDAAYRQKAPRADGIHTAVLIQPMNERLFLQFRQVDFGHNGGVKVQESCQRDHA